MNGTPLTVHCAFCRGVFLAPAVSAWNVIQCPHCGSQMPHGDCAPAQPDLQDQPTVIESSAEREAIDRARRHRRHLLVLGVIGAVVALASVALTVVQSLAARRNLPAASAPAADTGTTESAESDERRLDAASVVATRALACENWISALPFVRRAGRIEPLMERFHRQHPWRPLTLGRRLSARLVDRDGSTFAHLEAETTQGRNIEFHLEETSEGWKLDWEALVNAPEFEWTEFYRQQPADPRRLRINALRGSVPDAYFLTAGCEPAATLAVRLWGTQAGDSVIALVSRNSDLGHALDEELTWELPRQYVAEIRLADALAVPPRVNFIALLQKNWILHD